jgi:hypothetical protein
MLKHGEVNELAVFGLRRMEHCPPHFAQVEFDLHTDETVITDWIWAHLDGRFYVGDQYVATDRQKINQSAIRLQKVAAFEIAGEASYFALTLDLINKNPFEF